MIRNSRNMNLREKGFIKAGKILSLQVEANRMTGKGDSIANTSIGIRKIRIDIMIEVGKKKEDINRNLNYEKVRT